MIVHRTCLSTVDDRTFPIAATETWNSLPQHVTLASSLSVFRARLKTHLFLLLFASVLLKSALTVTAAILNTLVVRSFARLFIQMQNILAQRLAYQTSSGRMFYKSLQLGSIKI